MMTDYTKQLTAFATETMYDEISPEGIHATKRLLLDELACMLGAATTKRGKIFITTKKDLAGTPESTVIGGGYKTSCTDAAYVNGELAVTMDADEFSSCRRAGNHFANAIVASALAVGERVNASGKDILSAIAVGYEVAARIGYATPRPSKVVKHDQKIEIEYSLDTNPDHSWYVLGTATAAGRLLQLSHEQMVNAFGIAAWHAPLPTRKRFIRVSSIYGYIPMTKYAPLGMMAEGGVYAALLARSGFGGDPMILDGEYNLIELAGGKGCDWKPKRMLEKGIEPSWWITEAIFKAFPCCKIIQYPLTALDRLMKQHALTGTEIESVTLGMHPVWITPGGGHAYMTARIEAPINEVDFSFHARYCTAMYLMGIKPGPDWFREENLNSPKLKELAAKVNIVPEQRALEVMYEESKDEFTRVQRFPASAEVVVRGSKFKAETDFGKGDPWDEQARLTDEEMTEKFMVYSAPLVSSKHATKAAKLVFEFERVKTVRELTELLIGGH